MSDPRQQWATPWGFWRKIDDEFEFELDAAATWQNHKCIKFIHPDIQDSLTTPWITEYTKRVYCNPGFSNMMPWICKAVTEAEKDPGAVIAVMSLVSVSTDWWRIVMDYAWEVRLLAPRVQFVPAPGISQSSNARENSLLIFKGDRDYEHPLIWTWNWKQNTGRPETMTDLRDLEPDLNNLSDEELLERLKEIRANRRKRVEKKQAKPRQSKQPEPSGPKQSFEDLFGGE